MSSPTEYAFDDDLYQSSEPRGTKSDQDALQPTSKGLAVGSTPYLAEGRNEEKELAGFRIQRIMRWVGYGLFILYWVDVGYILYPPEFTNIVWEYQAMGDLVRLVPTLAISLILIFYGETADRKKIERVLLLLLSWATVLIAVFHLLMVPLTLVNAARISTQNNEQISTQVNQQKRQLEATQEQLEQATPEDLATLIPVPDEQGNLPNAPTTPEEAKTQVITRIGAARQAADTQAQNARENLRDNLLKNTAKIVIEAAIGAGILIYTWALTKWARHRKSYGRNAETLAIANQGKRLRKNSKAGKQSRKRRSV